MGLAHFRLNPSPGYWSGLVGMPEHTDRSVYGMGGVCGTEFHPLPMSIVMKQSVLNAMIAMRQSPSTLQLLLLLPS